jgi:hypothetical protein
VLTAVAPSAGTGTVDVTVTTAAGTSPVDTAKDSFTYGTNLALLATASASNTFQNLPDWAPSKAIDGNEETRWATDSGVTAATLDLTWPDPVSVSRTMFEEWTIDGQRIRQYQIQPFPSFSEIYNAAVMSLRMEIKDRPRPARPRDARTASVST